MKRVIIVIVLIILIWFGFIIVSRGFKLNLFNLNVASYKDIEKESNKLTESLAAYNKKNENDYDSAITGLNNSIKSYQESKEKYEKIVEEMGSTEEEQAEVLALSTKVYEIDFLLTTIGTYAEKESIDLTLNVEKSTLPGGSNIAGYLLCNLKFTAAGEYINISNFISDLESDDELAFEIRDYSMLPVNDTVSAEFNVYGVPINSATLIETNTNSAYTDTTSTNTTNKSGT